MEPSDHRLRVATFHSRPGGMLFPLYHVLMHVGEFARCALLTVEVSDPLEVEALALRFGARNRVQIANFNNETRQAWLMLPAATGGVTVGFLNESTFGAATMERDHYRARTTAVAEWAGRTTLDLQSFAIATVDERGMP
jgi:hypothetical protein